MFLRFFGDFGFLTLLGAEVVFCIFNTIEFDGFLLFFKVDFSFESYCFYWGLGGLDYYPFGMLVPNRFKASDKYRYGYNGKEMDNELKGIGNSIDLGDRVYDPRIGRTFTMDAYAHKFPGDSPYSFAMNTPLCAVDPDGKLIIFIGGLRLWARDADQVRSHKKRGTFGIFGKGLPGIYKTDVYEYWSTKKGKTNSFGRSVNMAERFKERLKDDKAVFTSGSAEWTSQAEDRKEDGVAKAEQFHAMVQKGEITLAAGETIKIVSHSQGGAHAEGFAEQLMTYKDAEGNPLYKIEVIYNITPHQPGDINAPDGIRSVQYSHSNDAVASDSPFWMPNGGTSYSEIKGVSEFEGKPILGGEGQPPATGALGNRNGHNVEDNDYIFDIQEGQPGYVAPRQDTPDVNKGG